jgi:hypothetical protein
MDKYFLELEFFSKNFFDKIILFFEKHLNWFWTNIWKAVISFLILNIIFFLISNYIQKINFSTEIFNEFAGFIYPFNEKITFFILLKNIINWYLIYWIIKSFKKYSRSL